MLLVRRQPTFRKWSIQRVCLPRSLPSGVGFATIVESTAARNPSLKRTALRVLSFGGVVGTCCLITKALDGQLLRAYDDESTEEDLKLDKEFVVAARRRLEERRQRLSMWRLVEIMRILAPLAFVWPLYFVKPDVWWEWVTTCMEGCGPCWVKLGQWLATRRDIFSESLCAKFERLQEKVDSAGKSLGNVNPEQVLENLKTTSAPLQQIESTPRASGSIAEVFFGVMEDGTEVAIKCVRPGIRALMEADLGWLLHFSNKVQQLEFMRYFGVEQCVLEFAEHLRMQVDLSVEGRHCRRFRRNFRNATNIRFPKTILAQEDVLVLSREDGEELVKYLRGKENESHEVKHAVAKQSLMIFFKMLFADRFVHGDLHPGNFMVHFPEENDESPFAWLRKMYKKVRERVSIGVSDCNFEIVVLDSGLAIPMTPDKVELLRKLTVCLLYANYSKAARLLFEMSPDSSMCKDPEGFQREVADVFRRSRLQCFEEGYTQVSDCCLSCLKLLRTYSIVNDSSLTWALLSMLSVEGAARQLDPSVDATSAAVCYIINFQSLWEEFSESNWRQSREMALQAVMERLGLDYYGFLLKRKHWRNTIRGWFHPDEKSQLSPEEELRLFGNLSNGGR